MFQAIDAAPNNALAEPRSMAELLPEVLARYGISTPKPARATTVAVHATHEQRTRRHFGPRVEQKETSDRRKTVRAPSAKQRLSA